MTYLNPSRGERIREYTSDNRVVIDPKRVFRKDYGTQIFSGENGPGDLFR
jgi:hypothetical protein